MNEPELRQALHATFDGARPRPDAADRAFTAVADSAHERLPGHRLASAAAAALAVLVITTLLIGRGVLEGPHATPAARPEPSAVASPGPSLPWNVSGPVHLAAFDASVALADWGGGTMLTRDGGVTWRDAQIPGGPRVSDFQWTDGVTVYAATSDGLFRLQVPSLTWRQLSPRSDLVSLDFLDQTIGYAVTAEGDVAATGDGGTTFTSRDVGIHPVSWLQWVSRTTAWAVGPGGIVATSDAGATWTRQLTLAPGGSALAGSFTAQVGFRDLRNGFAIFDRGGDNPPTVFHTADGGADWIANPPGPKGVLSPLVVTGPAQASLVATDAGAGISSICTTSDGARIWRCLPAPFVGAAGSAVLAVKGSTWLLAGGGLPIAVSQDSGGTWAIRRP